MVPRLTRVPSMGVFYFFEVKNMKRLTGAEIRRKWISFFESKGHKWLPGVNLIPQGDKSLLWVNAGVTGLKKYFDGSEIPPSRRIVNVQKSIRTNDIENVGHTARHHTFFEMLGNFSIGDYFRNEVIPWAYELLTNEETGFGIPVEKLYFTYNPMDKDTFELWKKCGVPESHLIPLEGNFWEIGEGPCGPDTEMFFDRGEEYDPDHLGEKLLREDMDNDRYIEIWNIVFSQFNSVAGVARKDYKELPSKNIDTGSGLERIACILQGTPTNFETDLFMPLIEATKALANKPYEGENLLPYRVIADHARCLTFALSDGAYFSNEGRGYVLRRIIRRAMRYGRKLGIEKPFIYDLVGIVAKMYEDFYPEITAKVDFVSKMIKAEEEKFLKTLSSGEALLLEMIKGKKELDGPSAFKLYDTFGFPLDMSKEIAEENGVAIDIDGFNKCMAEQKERARNARGQIESFHKQSKDLLEFNVPSEFTYEKTEVKSKVIGLFIDGNKVDSIEEEGEVAFEVTPFYAESGGQVSDEGHIESSSTYGEVLGVSKAPAGQHLIHVHLSYGSLHVGDELTQIVDRSKRALTARNHSATHLLHAALSNVLKEHVDQKGSFVNSSYLRFDFSFLRTLTKEELADIEKEVNEKIAEGIEEVTEVLPFEEAKTRGAEMEFSEKYGDTVRVVEFGEYSREFCGGTHVRNSSDIGAFVIVSEGAVSSGTRRIEARTSLGAYSYLSGKKEVLESVKEGLGGAIDTLIPSSLSSLKEENSALRKQIDSLKEKLASSEAESLLNEIEEIDGVAYLAKKVEGGRDELLKLGDSIKSRYADYLLFLAGSNGALLCFANGKALAKIKAGEAMKLAAPLLGGNGGGRPEMASGSAKDLTSFQEVVKLLREKL